MFIGIKMSDDIPTKEGFIRNSIDLDRSKGWELVSASTIMKNEFKYSGAKFEIVQSYLHAIDILSNPSYNGSYTPIQNKLPLLLQIKGKYYDEETHVTQSYVFYTLKQAVSKFRKDNGLQYKRIKISKLF